MPKALGAMGESVFYGCKKITRMTLPDDLSSLPKNTFTGCVALEHVDLPAEMTAIEASAFTNCRSLKTLDLPEGLASVDGYAFENTGLTQISLPGTLTEIKGYTFRNCSSLESAVLAEGIASIGTGAFTGTGLTGITLPKSLATIGAYAFENCAALATVDFSKGLTTINNAAFKGCTRLAEAELPEGVKAYKVATAAGSSARLEEVAVAVAAGTGLIFKGTKDATYNIPVAESASTLSGNLLVGVTDAAGYTTTSASDAYALSKSDGMLHPVAANVTIPAGKAYLPASYFASNARSISLVFDDETTGIGASLMNSERVNNEVYNLNGQRVAQPSKGLYIVNGRKVVIK